MKGQKSKLKVGHYPFSVRSLIEAKHGRRVLATRIHALSNLD